MHDITKRAMLLLTGRHPGTSPSGGGHAQDAQLSGRHRSPSSSEPAAFLPPEASAIFDAIRTYIVIIEWRNLMYRRVGGVGTWRN